MQLRTFDKAVIAWVVGAFLVAVLTLTGTLAWLVHEIARWHGKRWIDVLTMLGTVGAFFAVLFVANQNARRERREAMQRARVVAAEISVRLEDRTRHLHILIGSFSSVHELGEDAEIDYMRRNLESLRRYLDKKEGAIFFRRQTVLDLIPLPNEAAHRIARAQDLMRLIRGDLEKRTVTIPTGSPEMIRSIHTWADRVIKEAHRELTAALVECIEAARLSDPAVPALDVE